MMALDVGELLHRLAAVETRLAATELVACRAQARVDVENVWSRYVWYHNAYEDERIIEELWAAPGTPGIRARYNNTGSYTTWESVTAYHRGRPRPVGKLLFHYATTPVIEVAAHANTAKGVWIAAGLESGLTDPEVAGGVPEWVFSKGDVDGKRIWAHWVWMKYALDFVRQGSEWRILTLRCYEVARAPFDRDWVSFAAIDREALDSRLAWFGDDGVPVFLPETDEPAATANHPYAPHRVQTLDPVPPGPYTDFQDTFK
jgi:hypothetical protein